MLTPKRIVAASAALALLGAGVAFAAPLALAGLGLGRWQLHEIGATESRTVCVHDARQLIQLHHPGLTCQHFSIEDTASRTTIQYTCPGKGYARTTVRVENGNLIKLDTQGFGPDGLPFDVTYEGRRTGDCAR